MTRLPASLDQAFAFAHGRIGVLQQLLLGRSDVDRLLGAHDAREAEKVLTELKLTTQIDQGLQREEEILSAIASWLKAEIEHMAPEGKRDVFAILWLQGDAPLLAYLLKRKRGLTSAISQEPAHMLTTHHPDTLRALVETEESKMLPASLVTFVRATLAEENLDPADIDIRVARFTAAEQLKLAKRSGSKGIRLFVRHSIDIGNIRTVLRLIDAPKEERLRHLVPGGMIKPERLTGSRNEIAFAIEETGLGYGLADKIRQEETSGSDLERAFSDVLAADIARLWNVPLTVEPLFAFAALTLSQLRLLRVLLIGKRSGLSPQEIKKILPPFIPATHYVL